uniref:Uncharacterized protein n=1 Tax=Anguilla anguilla TaxID=7936 RepID=A0A0E9XGG2_ANGAN
MFIPIKNETKKKEKNGLISVSVCNVCLSVCVSVCVYIHIYFTVYYMMKRGLFNIFK